MIVKTLVENAAVSEDLGYEHGLSLYIETEKHRILFDTGAGPLFAENAEKMHVDPAAVDMAVISHGHSDHGGGLKTFLESNRSAKVFFSRGAFGGHYVRKPDGTEGYAGLSAALLPNDRFVFLDAGPVAVNSEVELFSGVDGTKWRPSANKTLFIRRNDTLEPDDFAHEQNMILTERKTDEQSNKTVLVAGCAHCGIVNILERFIKVKGFAPDCVIGGFHLFNPSTGENEGEDAIAGIADYLMSTNACFYTGHCTGTKPFERLKTLMGDRIVRIRAGSVLEL